MEVVSAERNAELLETVPHKNMEDMAVVYRFLIDSTDEGRSSILVTNKMLDNYGITPEQLHADAVKNAPEIRPIVIQGIPDEDEKIYEMQAASEKVSMPEESVHGKEEKSSLLKMLHDCKPEDTDRPCRQLQQELVL